MRSRHIIIISVLLCVCAGCARCAPISFIMKASPAQLAAKNVTVANEVAVSYVADGAITIDGDTSDWPAGAQLVAVGPSDPADLSATARVAFSETAFYIACDVIDDIHNNKDYPERMWQHDSFQFAIDPLLRRTIGRYGEYDSELGMCFTNNQAVAWRWQRPAGTPGERVKGARVAVKLHEGRAVYEARFPLEELWPMRPELGPCGFAYLVHDRDTGEREAFAPWSSGIGSGKDPSSFGLLRFAGSPAKVAARFLLPVDPTPASRPQEWSMEVYAARAGKLTVTCDGVIEHGERKGEAVFSDITLDVPAGFSVWTLTADLSPFAPARLKLRPTATLDGAKDEVPAREFTVYVYGGGE